MESYRLAVKESVAKDLRTVPNADVARILARVNALSEDPRPSGCEKLSGQERYRLRQGDYRILYEIDDGRRTVTVVKVGHRRDVYHRGP
jgi:mRNA interferase RelE/StbE